MLTRASFDNFKNLRRVGVDLSRLTVLVGPNGAGKTSVLQGLHVVTEAVQHLAQSVQKIPSKYELSLPSLRNSSTAQFLSRFPPSRLATHRHDTFQIALSEGSTGATLTLRAKGGQGPNKDQFTIELPGGHSDLVENLPKFLRKAGAPRLPPFPSSVLLQLDTGRMVRPSVVEEAEPKLAYNGEGLASVLSYLAGAYPDRKEAIEADVAAVVPWFRRVRITPAKVSRLATRPFPVGHEAVRVPVEEEVWGHQFAVESKDGAVVPADLLSEGTVLALGLLTLLHDPKPPQLLLIDDIDRALHLGAQVRLVRTLRKLQEARPELQIVASTHSPFLLQEIAADDVRVLGLTKAGVRCRTLSSHPDYERWKSVLSTGEIWANLGEDWVGDGA